MVLVGSPSVPLLLVDELTLYKDQLHYQWRPLSSGQPNAAAWQAGGLTDAAAIWTHGGEDARTDGMAWWMCVTTDC